MARRPRSATIFSACPEGATLVLGHIQREDGAEVRARATTRSRELSRRSLRAPAGWSSNRAARSTPIAKRQKGRRAKGTERRKCARNFVADDDKGKPRSKKTAAAFPPLAKS